MKFNRKIAILLTALMFCAVLSACAKGTAGTGNTADTAASAEGTTAVKGKPTGKTSSAENAVEGDTVIFGGWEQDNFLSSGNEKIAWRVLAAEKDKILLLSEMILDSKPYNDVRKSTSWETCSLRKWLNKDFLNGAFTAAEQAEIITADTVNDGNAVYNIPGGNDTKDKIFLLSTGEAKMYLSNLEVRCAKGTGFAKSEGLFAYPDGPYKGKSSWWLRSPGANLFSAADVFYSGDAGDVYDFADNASVGVRPALWLNR